MTITINPTRNEFTATAGQTVFTYTYKIFAATDLNVFQTPAGQDCDDTTDQITTFTVTGVGDEDGGTIILNTGATVGDLITIVSDIPDNRTTDYQFNGDFLPDTVNDDFDRTVSLVKQTNERSSRSLQFEQCLQGVTNLSLPTPSAGLYLTWKGDLSGMENAGAPVIIITTTNIGVVADMKASATLTIGDILTTTGYVTAGDGGDNQYEIVAGGTGTDDSGTFIDLTTSGLQAKGLFPRGIFNVEQFDNVFASAAAGTSGKELVISSAISESSNVSIASSLIILNIKHGGLITLTGGAILNFDNPSQIKADRRQKIFSISTFTQIVFTNRGTVHAGWWGFSITETAANNTTALGFALNITKTNQGNCWMELGIFLMNPLTITVSVEKASFGLFGMGVSWIDQTTPSDTGTILHFPTATGSSKFLSITHSGTIGGSMRLEKFELFGPSDHRTTQATTTTGLDLNGFPRSFVHQVMTGHMNNGILSTKSFNTVYDRCIGIRTAFGITTDTDSAQIMIRDYLGEVNQVGIRVKEATALHIISPQLESCTTGIYINPDNGVNIRNVIIENPYFEGNTGTIDIGRDTYNVKNGDIRDIHLIGSFFDSSTFPIIRNALDVTFDMDQQYVRQFDIDSTVSWSMPTTGAFSIVAAGGSASQSIGFTEFTTHINQTLGGTVTLTLPDINICPRLTPYTLVRTDTNAGLVIIDGFSAQPINGVATISLDGVGSTVTVWRDTINTEQWRIQSGGPAGVERNFNPPDLATLAVVSQTVTVTGARLGDKAVASFSLDVQDITIDAQVTASDVVTAVFFNPTGGNINLGTGDIFATVTK